VAYMDSEKNSDARREARRRWLEKKLLEDPEYLRRKNRATDERRKRKAGYRAKKRAELKRWADAHPSRVRMYREKLRHEHRSFPEVRLLLYRIAHLESAHDAYERWFESLDFDPA